MIGDSRLRSVSLPTAAAAVLLAALPGAAAAVPPTRVSTGSPPPSSAPAPGSATASLRACRVAVDQTQRSATFVAEMTATPQSSRMELRLRLLTRSGWHQRFTQVDAPGLGLWQRALTGRNEFIYAKQVTNLPAPAQYRAVVSYRWLDAHGQVIRRAHRRSAICVQPDQSASLSVTRLDITTGSAGDRYVVRMRNDGRTASDPFVLTLSVGGVAQPPVSMPTLGVRQSTRVAIVAPACQAGSMVTVALAAAPTSAPGTQSTGTQSPGTQPTPPSTTTHLPALPSTFSCTAGPQLPLDTQPPESTTRRPSHRPR